MSLCQYKQNYILHNLHKNIVAISIKKKQEQ